LNRQSVTFARSYTCTAYHTPIWTLAQNTHVHAHTDALMQTPTHARKHASADKQTRRGTDTQAKLAATSATAARRRGANATCLSHELQSSSPHAPLKLNAASSASNVTFMTRTSTKLRRQHSETQWWDGSAAPNTQRRIAGTTRPTRARTGELHAA
jgi:hypothetical protein